jgi:uncharacterized protein
MTTLVEEAQAPTTLAPVQPAERIAVLDILRGFALLGICVINVPGFYSPYFFEAAGEALYPAARDRAATWLVDLLGSGKFNSMFSFLFGVGFAIQLDRAAGRGASFVGTYLRRLLVLFAIGVAHCLLIWNGDVLHIYAVLGLPLLLLRNVRDRWLWAVAAASLLVPIGFAVSEYLVQKPNPHPPSYWRARAEDQLRIYGRGSYDELLAGFAKGALQGPARPVVGRGSYLDAVGERWRETREDYFEHDGIWFWPILGTTITIGFLVGRRRVFQQLCTYLPAVRRLAWWTGGIGLGLGAAFATCSLLQDHASRTPTLPGLMAEVFYLLDRPVLCGFYICIIVLLAQRPAWERVLAPLADAGRMPLTNYLMQSVIHSAIFYGYGLGLYGRVGPATGVLIALGTFAAQVLYSRAWLSRFRFGPMEWLWRTLSYGKPPAMSAGVAPATI